jgi:hypothetical protein
MKLTPKFPLSSVSEHKSVETHWQLKFPPFRPRQQALFLRCTGELVVFHGGVDHVFDFAPLSGDREQVQWAAMYGDCLHEVKEVKKGYRATLTFSIIQEEEAKPDRQRTVWYDPKRPRVRDNLSGIKYKINVDPRYYDHPKTEVGNRTFYLTIAVFLKMIKDTLADSVCHGSQFRSSL